MALGGIGIPCRPPWESVATPGRGVSDMQHGAGSGEVNVGPGNYVVTELAVSQGIGSGGEGALGKLSQGVCYVSLASDTNCPCLCDPGSGVGVAAGKGAGRRKQQNPTSYPLYPKMPPKTLIHPTCPEGGVMETGMGLPSPLACSALCSGVQGNCCL